MSLKITGENGFTFMSLELIEWAGFLDAAVTGESAITVGVFDGVHLGHKALIDRIVRRGPNPTVVTFRDNPKKTVSGAPAQEERSDSGQAASRVYEGDLYSLKQKLAVFDDLGVRRVVLIDFSPDFSKLSGREFLEILQKSGRMVFLAIGVNFRCGFQQDTGSQLIREINDSKGITTELVPPVTEPLTNGSGPVSSSRIRSAIICGDLKLARALMGRNFGLDLSDINPVCGRMERKNRKTYIYDLRSVQRISPARGQYSVLMYPGRKAGEVEMEDGKVFLPQKVECLEFIGIQQE